MKIQECWIFRTYCRDYHNIQDSSSPDEHHGPKSDLLDRRLVFLAIFERLDLGVMLVRCVNAATNEVMDNVRHDGLSRQSKVTRKGIRTEE